METYINIMTTLKEEWRKVVSNERHYKTVEARQEAQQKIEELMLTVCEKFNDYSLMIGH